MKISKYLVFLSFFLASIFSTVLAEETISTSYSYIDIFQTSSSLKNKALVQNKIDAGKMFLENNNMIVNGVKNVVFFNTPADREKIYIKIVYLVEIKDGK